MYLSEIFTKIAGLIKAMLVEVQQGWGELHLLLSPGEAEGLEGAIPEGEGLFLPLSRRHLTERALGSKRPEHGFVGLHGGERGRLPGGIGGREISRDEAWCCLRLLAAAGPLNTRPGGSCLVVSGDN
jgi:hypothetical protein